ncbi:hypothetical protein D3C73_1182380 [compost metagenome]
MFRFSADAADKIVLADHAIFMVQHFFQQRGLQASQGNLHAIFGQRAVGIAQSPGFSQWSVRFGRLGDAFPGVISGVVRS